MQIDKGSIIFFVLLFVAVCTSLSFTAYRYLVREDFAYFITEEEIPSRFSLSSYIP